MPDRTKIVRIAGVERQTRSTGGRRKEKVDRPCSPCLTARRHHRRIDPAVSTCRFGVEGEWIERGFRSLEPILAARSLFGIRDGSTPCYRASRQGSMGVAGQAGSRLGGLGISPFTDFPTKKSDRPRGRGTSATVRARGLASRSVKNGVPWA